MPRAIWKGAISFGLVHVPIALYPASSDTGIDFDWLDKRSMDPVGYKRINKRTGKEVTKENIVKGVKVKDDSYVILSEDEIKAAYPRSTQTIEIEAFVKAEEIPLEQFEKPYYLEPLPKGDKVYALLRETMLASGVVGIARVVMHTKEYLAALIPREEGLILNTLRWAQEIRPLSDLKLPETGKKALKDSDIKMAKQLIADMTTKWKPDAYADKFTHAIHALVAKRQKAGATETVEAMEDAGQPASNVIDLTALLAQSLKKRHGGSAKHSGSAAKADSPKASRKRA
jgi:DNA end-binding protein Ku